MTSPTGTPSPVVGVEIPDGAVRGRGDLHDRLVRLHLDHQPVLLQGVSGLDEPPDDLPLGQPLADVREFERSGGHGNPTASRIPSRTRTAFGSW